MLSDQELDLNLNQDLGHLLPCPFSRQTANSKAWLLWTWYQTSKTRVSRYPDASRPSGAGWLPSRRRYSRAGQRQCKRRSRGRRPRCRRPRSRPNSPPRCSTPCLLSPPGWRLNSTRSTTAPRSSPRDAFGKFGHFGTRLSSVTQKI